MIVGLKHGLPGGDRADATGEGEDQHFVLDNRKSLGQQFKKSYGGGGGYSAGR
jgi:hypothetical protein